jgi:GH15 family glucan-1,4-alpha-glucosidase
VEVPDRQIQSLVDSSIRNIWQAREIKGGLPAFQVGPSVYRGLWIVDGAFLLEAATMLGKVDEARAGITYMLNHQNSNGSFEVLDKYYKENGIVLWACIQHARLTSDKAWLESIWPKLEKTVAYIKELRKLSYSDPNWLCQGLIPPGFVDGGVHFLEKGDYSNVYWNLAGLKAMISAATWLGKAGQAEEWQKEYDDFYSVFQTSARRDMRKDAHGISYLPDGMGNVGNLPPQKGQWAFFHGVYPGKIFKQDDPVVTGNMEMFQACEEQGGLIVGNAGLAEGVWGYLASFHAHAWLWLGEGRKAVERLYGFGNHASPLLVWREEQNTTDNPESPAGDMPHNWASAEFIRLVVHLLALDRGDELHLLEGLPREWLKADMVTKLNGVLTPFGPLTLELKVAADGQSASLKVEPLLSKGGCRNIVLHLPSGETRSFDPSNGIQSTLSLR